MTSANLTTMAQPEITLKSKFHAFYYIKFVANLGRQSTRSNIQLEIRTEYIYKINNLIPHPWPWGKVLLEGEPAPLATLFYSPGKWPWWSVALVSQAMVTLYPWTLVMVGCFLVPWTLVLVVCFFYHAEAGVLSITKPHPQQGRGNTPPGQGSKGRGNIPSHSGYGVFLVKLKKIILITKWYRYPFFLVCLVALPYICNRELCIQFVKM